MFLHVEPRKLRLFSLVNYANLNASYYIKCHWERIHILVPKLPQVSSEMIRASGRERKGSHVQPVV